MVTAIGEYLDALAKYVTFKGRATRRQFWTFILVSLGINLTLTFVEFLLRGLFGWERTSESALANLYSLAVFLPTMAVGARRMQDTNHPGWWILVPIANVIFAFTDGTPGTNKYGHDPKGRDQVSAAQ